MLEQALLEAPTIKLPPIADELPYEDGIPMETPYHRAQMNLLIDVTDYQWLAREDYYVGGNMFVYFSQAQIRNRDYRGPDFFIVTDVDGTRERNSWVVWEEDGRYPELIVELLSESTAEVDKTVKKHLYERTFRTHEYYCYDIATQELLGWRLGVSGRYDEILPNADGQLWSETLQLWLGTWHGSYQKNTIVWLRMYDDTGRLVPTLTEAEAARAAQEAARANRAEAELAQARAELAQLRGDKKS